MAASQPSPAPDSAPAPWLRHIGLMNDYVRVPYANGSSFASQFLYRQLGARGVDVTVLGPHEADADPSQLPPQTLTFGSLPMRHHPGVYLSFPTPHGLEALQGAELDLLLAQTCNAQLYAGAWLRERQRVPYVCVNTVHLPSIITSTLPNAMLRNKLVMEIFEGRLLPWLESSTVTVYNHADHVVVLSPGMERYWRGLGVTTPMTVIPRAIEPRIFNQPAGADPFPATARRGARLLAVCRHAREKRVDQLVRIFAEHVLPSQPDATLTLVGDGPDHDFFRKGARKLGVGDSVYFVGEQPLMDIPNWYAHADLFVYTSLSETFGQVIGEAMWCGLPVVAMADGMGVSGQVQDGVDGLLTDPSARDAEALFGARVLQLLADEDQRKTFGEAARASSHTRATPERVMEAYLEVFAKARAHMQADPGPGGPGSSVRAARLLAEWTSLHAVAYATGLMRRPAELNRNHSPAPDWNLTAADAAQPAASPGDQGLAETGR